MLKAIRGWRKLKARNAVKWDAVYSLLRAEGLSMSHIKILSFGRAGQK
jgi:hypothetical protein